MNAFQFLCLAVLAVSPLTFGASGSGIAPAAVAGTAVPTPPMGWNSWDSYGTSVNEQQVKANADWMAKHLKAYGWQYITVDMEWFVTDPVAEGNAKNSHYQIDAYGRFMPAVGRFPSAKDGRGFKPLADYVPRRCYTQHIGFGATADCTSRKRRMFEKATSNGGFFNSWRT